MKYDIKNYGENGLLISFKQKIDIEINNNIQVIDSLINLKLKGILYSIPAYTTLTLTFDSKIWGYDDLKNELIRLIDSSEIDIKSTLKRKIQIPVCYDSDFSLDMEEVETLTGLSKNEIVKIHSSPMYYVFMVGFVPGFPYMGVLPKELNCKRKKTPVLSVPTGSVAIAGNQTGIYPNNVPGGWMIIGRTPISLFNQLEEKFLIKAGDWVKFNPISRKKFDVINSKIEKREFSYDELFH